MKRETNGHRYYLNGEFYHYNLYQLIYGYKENQLLHDENHAGEQTGIYDTTNIMIYTGDIVSVPYIDPCGNLTKDENYKSEVYFINGCYAIKSYSGAQHIPLSQWLKLDKTDYVPNVGEVSYYLDASYLTVVGNIYEPAKIRTPYHVAAPY